MAEEVEDEVTETAAVDVFAKVEFEEFGGLEHAFEEGTGLMAFPKPLDVASLLEYG